MRTDLALLAVMLAAAAPAGATDTEGDVLLGPVSVAQLGSSVLYGTYDVGKAFVNPSLLSNQPRTVATSFGTQARFGGQQWLTTAAVGWVGEPTDVGTFGGALMVSHLTAPEIIEIDAAGSPTGVTVSPGMTAVAVAALYQWNFFSIGAEGAIGRMDLGTLNADKAWGTSVAQVAGGTTLTLGRMDLGVGFRMADGLEGTLIHGGLAFRTGGWFKGTVGGTFDVEVGTGNSNNGGNNGSTGGPAAFFPTTNPDRNARDSAGGGFTWDVRPYLTVRGGVLGGPGGASAVTGFSVPWRDWSFDYALQLPLGGGEGAAHAVGVGWNIGGTRKAQEGPKFFLKQEERTLAVATFDPQNVSAGDAAVISDMLRNQLIKEGAFNIVEKANMDKVLNEQAFQQTGCTTQECAVKLGKVLNVKFLVVGTFGKALDQYVVSMRVIEVETAKAVYSDEAYGKDLPGVRDGITKMAVSLTEAVKNSK